MIFVYPVFYRFNHKLAHHLLLTGCLIITTRAIGILTVCSLTIEIIRICTLEITAVDVPCVIIHYIKDNSDSCLVQSLHHLFELFDTCSRCVRVSRIRTFRHVIIQRVVTPVVLRFIETSLINRGIVVRRQDMNSINAKSLQMIDSLLLCQRKEFAFVYQTRRLMDREITVVHLINHEVGWRLYNRTHITLPPFWISGSHINNSSALTIYANSFSKKSCALSISHVKRIEAVHHITLHRSFPSILTGKFHLHRLQCLAIDSILIDSYLHAFSLAWRKNLKRGLLRCIIRFLKIICHYGLR